MGAYLRVYQAMKNTIVPVSLATRVIDRANRTVYGQTVTLPENAFNAATHSAEYRLELPLGRLAPGEHLLAIDATAGGRMAQRAVRFSIKAP